MLKIKEDLLQYVWQHKLTTTNEFISTTNNKIKIIHFGTLNQDSGPDFFNAKIKVNELILAGNIEIHVKTSDWEKHGHQFDESYSNIILHVVYEHDREIAQNTENLVEVIELKKFLSPHLIVKYQKLIESKNKIPCQNSFDKIEDFKFSSWLQRLSIERLEKKTERIEQLFLEFNGDYHQTFYTLLLSAFGFKTNALPFELLAKQLPYNVLIKHSDQLFQLESLLLGTSGFLDEQFEDNYLSRLSNEFIFLQAKYKLIPLDKRLFKFSKMRPANFPTLRLAQFAAFFGHGCQVLSNFNQLSNLNQVMNIFNISVSEYWKTHYSLGGNKVNNTDTLGKDSAEKIIINAIVPFLFFYSRKVNQDLLRENALELLSNCKWEENKKTKLFLKLRKPDYSAADSQAMINLFDNYCSKKRCLNCNVGMDLLKRN